MTIKAMTSLDTNVLVRLIARDDQKQLEQARDVISSNDCFVPDTVLLELTWVLKSRYGATAEQIGKELLKVLGLENIRVADPERIRLALKWYEDGLEFADALHLASSQHAEAFVTFDQRFIRRSEGKGNCPVKDAAKSRSDF